MADRMAEKFAVPLSVADVFDYLVPGTALLLAVFLFEAIADASTAKDKFAVGPSTPISTSLSLLHQGSPGSDWVLSLVFAIGLIIAVYVLGHVVGSISSLVVDRVLVFKGYGYPYHLLLGLKSDAGEWRKYTGPFYRGMFFWTNAYLLARLVSLVSRGKGSFGSYVVWNGFAMLFALLISIGVLAKVVTNIPHGKRINVFKRALDNRFGAALTSVMHYYILVPFAGPYDLTACRLGGLINTRSPFPKKFLAAYRKKFDVAFGMDPDSAGTHNFWLCYAYIQEHSDKLSRVLGNWLKLYVFSRNLATALYLAFLYSICWFSWQYHTGRVIHEYAVGQLQALSLSLFVISMLMLVRYYYLYVAYFTKFVFRAFVVITPPIESLADAAEVSGAS